MLNPRQVMDTYYLDVRSMLLEIAATLDRHDAAAEGEAAAVARDDPRRQKIEQALRFLAAGGSRDDRTEQLLLHFSEEPVAT